MPHTHCIYASDLTDGSSFERAKFWVNELKQSEEVCCWSIWDKACVLHFQHHLECAPSQGCSVHLCGTKFDLVEADKKARKVDVNAAKEYADGGSNSMLSVSYGC